MLNCPRQAQQETTAFLLGPVALGPEELVDRFGRSAVLEELEGRRTAIKAAPTRGWQTSSAIRPATFSPVGLMWATAAKVCLQSIKKNSSDYHPLVL